MLCYNRSLNSSCFLANIYVHIHVYYVKHLQNEILTSILGSPFWQMLYCGCFQLYNQPKRIHNDTAIIYTSLVPRHIFFSLNEAIRTLNVNVEIGKDAHKTL